MVSPDRRDDLAVTLIEQTSIDVDAVGTFGSRRGGQTLLVYLSATATIQFKLTTNRQTYFSGCSHPT